MTRVELICEIFSQTGFLTYLEIGTRSGTSFFPVRCRNKIAIDPEFAIPWEKKAKWMILNPHNLRAKYFEETSDEFFKNRKEYLESLPGLDVVLIDGLHTYTASLTDVRNALRYLNENGIIVLHDCNPPHEAAALPSDQYPTEEERNIEGWDGVWNGDVWKTIVYLRENFSETLEVLVLDTDYGLGIVRFKPGSRERVIKNLSLNDSSFERIKQMTYREMKPKTGRLLNLKPKDHKDLLLKEITSNISP
jgi:hypothetical protein